MTAPHNLLPISTDDGRTNYDVIVVGGGPSGCTAAAAAARDGARTLLIESTGALGGSGTNALVPAWCPFSNKQEIIYRGLALKVFNEARSGMRHVTEDWVDWTPIDPERLKVVYDDLVSGFGVEVLFNTIFVDVRATDATYFPSVRQKSVGTLVQSINVVGKFGAVQLSAKVFVDCSGDGDVAAAAGSIFELGNNHGTVMPATHCFILTNVDENAFRLAYGGGTALENSNPKSPIYRILESGRFPLISDSHIICTLIGPRTVGFNAGHIWNVDSSNPVAVSKALMLGRKMAVQYRDALAEFCPDAFADAFLVTTANTIGIRESRRILGDYTLTLNDYLARRTFEDEICRNSYFIDVHQTMEEAIKIDASRAEQIKPYLRYNPGESHGIPYRCLTPSGLRNVLVAGRTISCERAVQGSIRVMPVCLAMGEAAGMAAALAAADDGDVHEVDTKILRKKLREAGAYLP